MSLIPDFDRTDVDILCISGKSDIVQKPVDPADPTGPHTSEYLSGVLRPVIKRETYAVSYTGKTFRHSGMENLCVCTWKNIQQKIIYSIAVSGK